MKRKVMALSGGGCKGISQISVLEKLESELSGKLLCEKYHLLAGSSVGAINSAIIATGKMTMKELGNIYEDMLKRVFKRKFGTPKYDSNNFFNVWNEIIGAGFKFGDVKTKLMITSVDLVSDENHFFKSWHEDDAEERLVDVVMRSFAAPLYFGHIVDKKNQKVWSDGGVGNANLPLNELKLQIESFGWYDQQDEIDDDTTNKVLVDALGCLYYNPHYTFKDVSKHRWLRQVLDFMNPKNGGLARAQSKLDQIRMMKYISSKNPNINFRYWDYEIPEKMDILDGVKYCNEYVKFGLEMAKNPIIDI